MIILHKLIIKKPTEVFHNQYNEMSKYVKSKPTTYYQENQLQAPPLSAMLPPVSVNKQEQIKKI